MQITLGSTITVEHPSIELVAWCKENLTITNPEYAQKMRMHLWLGNTPRYLALYETRGTTLILPFGVLRRVMQFIGNADVQTDFPQGTAINYGCSVPLYDYQEEAVDAFYGYSTHKADADFLYGWYIVELTAKLNRVIQVLKEEADFGEFGSIFKIEPIIDTDLFGAPAGILNYPGIVKSYAPVPLAKAGVIANIVQEYGESYVHSFLRASDPGLLATTYRSNSVLNVYAEGLRTGAMNYDVPIETISRTALTPLVFVGYMRYITQSRTEIMATVDI